MVELKPEESKQMWRYFVRRLWVEKKSLLPSFVFALISAAAQAGIAAFVGKFTDQTLVNKIWVDRTVLLYCFGAVGIISVTAISEYAHKYLLRVALERFAQKIRIDMMSRYLTFSEALKNRMGSSEAINHVVTDVQLLSEVRHFITEMVKEPLTLLALLGYVLYLNWKLSVVCVLAIIPIGLMNSLLGRSARRNQQRVQKKLSDVILQTNENFQGMRTVHSFVLEKTVLKNFRSLMDTLMTTLLKISRLEESVGPVIKIISVICGAVIMYSGAYYVAVERSLTMGQLVSFALAAGLLQAPLKNISYAAVQIQRISAGANRIWLLFTTPYDQLSRDQANLISNDRTYAVPTAPLALEFSDVSFRYPTPTEDRPHGLALDKLSFTLAPGKKIALVGKSGSGKTTLSLLALRLIDVTSGKVNLGEKDVKEWELGEYRSYFSYVSQEVYFFQGSFKENLLRAAPLATEEEIWAALELAQLRDKIQSLPDGLETLLTEKAANLSGGERQRLAIARAILRNSPILVLDEATSALDSENEKLIQRGLDHLLQKRSAIIVAHRLSTIINCDEILVFDRGVIIERGSPAELRRADSAFQRMWKLQQGESSPA